jgi:hypothetical protein
MTTRYRWTRGEPSLSEVLDDEVILAVMDCDGVSHQELDALIRRVQHRLQPGHGRLPTPANDAGRRPSL